MHEKKPLENTILKGPKNDKYWDSSHAFLFQLKLFECTEDDVDEDEATPIGDCRFGQGLDSSSEIKWIQKGELSTGPQSLDFLDTFLATMGVRYTLLQDESKVMGDTSLAMLRTLEGKEPFYGRFGFHTMNFHNHHYSGAGAHPLESQDIEIEAEARERLRSRSMGSFLETLEKVDRENVESIKKSLIKSKIKLEDSIEQVLSNYKSKTTVEAYNELTRSIYTSIHRLLTQPIATLKEKRVDRDLYFALNVSFHHVYMLKDRGSSEQDRVAISEDKATENKHIWTWKEYVENVKSNPATKRKSGLMRSISDSEKRTTKKRPSPSDVSRLDV